MTRSHTDVDLVTWTRHAARVRRLLGAKGYGLVKNTAAQSNFEKRGQDVDVVTELRARIEDVECRVIHPRALLEEKATYLRHTGKPLRFKDRRSIKDLKRVLFRPTRLRQPDAAARAKGRA